MPTLRVWIFKKDDSAKDYWMECSTEGFPGARTFGLFIEPEFCTVAIVFNSLNKNILQKREVLVL